MMFVMPKLSTKARQKMKWPTKQRPQGDTRTRRVFLWWPKSDGKVTRWLEFATIEEKLTAMIAFEIGIGTCSYTDWDFVRFVDA